jgi:hypothetical protein
VRPGLAKQYLPVLMLDTVVIDDKKFFGER